MVFHQVRTAGGLEPGSKDLTVLQTFLVAMVSSDSDGLRVWGLFLANNHVYNTGQNETNKASYYFI